MNEAAIVADIVRQRVIDLAYAKIVEAKIVPDEVTPESHRDFFDAHTSLRVRNSNVDVNTPPGTPPVYHAYGDVRCDFHGNARGYTMNFHYSLMVTLADVMAVIAEQAAVELDKSQEDPEWY